MSVDMMDRKVKELRELKRMQEELATEIEAIQDELKAHMDTHGMDTLGRTGRSPGRPSPAAAWTPRP